MIHRVSKPNVNESCFLCDDFEKTEINPTARQNHKYIGR